MANNRGKQLSLYTRPIHTHTSSHNVYSNIICTQEHTYMYMTRNKIFYKKLSYRREILQRRLYFRKDTKLANYRVRLL